MTTKKKKPRPLDARDQAELEPRARGSHHRHHRLAVYAAWLGPGGDLTYDVRLSGWDQMEYRRREGQPGGEGHHEGSDQRRSTFIATRQFERLRAINGRVNVHHRQHGRMPRVRGGEISRMKDRSKWQHR
jgi:hypothetical protein